MNFVPQNPYDSLPSYFADFKVIDTPSPRKIPFCFIPSLYFFGILTVIAASHLDVAYLGIQLEGRTLANRSQMDKLGQLGVP